jgi:hypothetical protein
MKHTLAYPPGLNKPIRVTGGKGDHAELGTISKATYLLLLKNAGVDHELVFCEACDAYHVGGGMSVDDGKATSNEASSQRESKDNRTKAPKVRFNRGK